jgi:hypothetical protein
MTLVETIFNILHTTFVWTSEIAGIYLLWIVIHYFASILYAKFCTPSNLFGFILSPMLVITPYCQGFRWIIYTGGNIITNMWTILATWIASKLCSNLLNRNANNKLQ